MSAMLPIAIIVVLGALSGLVMGRFRWNFALRASAAALLATVLWVCGCLLLLLATGEEGPLLLRPIVYTFLTALPPALIVSWRSRTHRSHASSEQSG